MHPLQCRAPVTHHSLPAAIAATLGLSAPAQDQQISQQCRVPQTVKLSCFKKVNAIYLTVKINDSCTTLCFHYTSMKLFSQKYNYIHFHVFERFGMFVFMCCAMC